MYAICMAVLNVCPLYQIRKMSANHGDVCLTVGGMSPNYSIGNGVVMVIGADSTS